MRKTFLAMLAIAASLGSVPAASAAQVDASVAHDQASGSGTFLEGQRSFEFSAQSDPLGNNASGQYTFTIHGTPDRTFTGQVTCLTVIGNTAHIAGITSNAPGIGTDVPTHFSVQDNGSSGDLISNLTFGFLPPDETVACGAVPLDNVVDGQIVVEDAQCDKFKPKKNGDFKCQDKKGPGLPLP